MNQEVLSRVQQELQRQRLDAYVAYTPSNFYYVTGYQSRHLDSWREVGSGLGIVPADRSQAAAMIVRDVEVKPATAASSMSDVRTFVAHSEARDLDIISGDSPTPADFTRPSQYDPNSVFQELSDVLKERGITRGRIGTDLRHIRADSLDRMQRACPDATFVDLTDAMYSIRAIKLPIEIERLRKAAGLFEAGVKSAIAEVREGMTGTDVRCLYEMGVLRAVLDDPTITNYQGASGLVSVGSGVKQGLTDSTNLKRGDLIKFDCGADLAGYRSDCGRTFVFGRPNESQQKLYDALRAAFEAMRTMLRPGVKMSEIFRTAQDTVRSRGFPRYTRGHFGHSIGLDSATEEPPYVSADEEGALEPGMVICVETPCHTAQLGTLQIEDMVLITEDGHENLNTLSYELVAV